MTAVRILALALLWCVLTRELSTLNAAVGLALGGLLVAVTGAGRSSPTRGRGHAAPPGLRGLGRRALLRPLLALELVAFFLFDLVVSNVRVALLILRPRLRLRPMILAIPVETQAEEELAVLSDLVTLTPGTLSLDVSDDGGTLLVHFLVAGDPREVRRRIDQDLVRRVRRLFA